MNSSKIDLIFVLSFDIERFTFKFYIMKVQNELKTFSGRDILPEIEYFEKIKTLTRSGERLLFRFEADGGFWYDQIVWHIAYVTVEGEVKTMRKRLYEDIVLDINPMARYGEVETALRKLPVFRFDILKDLTIDLTEVLCSELPLGCSKVWSFEEGLFVETTDFNIFSRNGRKRRLQLL